MPNCMFVSMQLSMSFTLLVSKMVTMLSFSLPTLAFMQLSMSLTLLVSKMVIIGGPSGQKLAADNFS